MGRQDSRPPGNVRGGPRVLLPRAFRSLRARLTVWYVALTALFLVVFGVITYALLLRLLERRVDESLVAASRSFERALRMELATAPASRSLEDILAEEAEELTSSDSIISVFRPDGALLETRPDERSTRLRSIVVRPHPDAFFTLHEGSDDALRVFQRPLPLRGRAFLLSVVRPVSDLDEFLEAVHVTLLIGVPFWAACVGLLGYWLVRKTLQPVLEMSREAGAIGAADLARRIPVHDPEDELGHLALTFNGLLDRLTATLDQQRRFMADASHELRTPVAIVRGEAEVALSREDRDTGELRGSLAVIEQEGRLLSAIIEDLFLLARADAGQLVLAPASFYLDELIAEVIRSHRSLAARKSIELVAGEMPESAIEADERLVRRLLVNLIDNAVKYTAEEGRVEVSLSRSEGIYEIAVADNGSPIGPVERERIFERFYRGSSVATGDGAGLGLPIARSIAELHGGTVELRSADEDVGKVFRVELPMTPTRQRIV